ncbi:MAG: hypothetical protein LBP73_07365, partial [Clostridiales Family XIII bacterium]|nr:hypothetical protein [Clostridiales Family XIII bacterium]
GTDYTVYAFVIKDQERFFPAGRYPNWRSDDATALGAISNVSQDVLEALGPGYLSKVVSFSFKTQGQSRPSLASVRARFDDNNMLEIDVAASGAVNLYYIVLQESAGAVPPTPVELKNGAGRAAGSLTVANIPANGGTLTIPGGFIAAAEIVGPAPLTKYIFDTPYRLYAVVEGMGAGGDSPAEFSDVVWSDVFTKTQPSSTLANIQIFAIAWNPPPKDPIFGLNAVNPAAQFNPNTYNYPGPGNAGVKVPNSYKQIRVTPTLPANAPANTSIRVNGTMLPASGFIDLTMPAVAGTPFEVKVDVSAPGAQTVSYTVLLKEDAPSVPQLYVADAMDPNPQPDGNGSYEVRLQPGVAQRDVSVRIDIDPEMIGAEFSVNGNVIGPVVRPPNAFNSWQVTIPLNASSPTDVTIRVAGPTQNPETRTYTLRIHH